MVCNGICQAISSYVFGRLVKYIGRSVVFIIAALINYAMIILMFLWEPKQSEMTLLFVIAGFWGIADAIWQTQVIGMIIRKYNFNLLNNIFQLLILFFIRKLIQVL
jgi:predicted MFS family arabinose efflux permease